MLLDKAEQFGAFKLILDKLKSIDGFFNRRLTESGALFFDMLKG